jgi:transposase-like protein
MTESKRKPPSINEPKVEALLQALNAGHYVERASRMSGISLTTIYRWLDEGRTEKENIEAGNPPTDRGQAYFELAEAIQKAREAAAHRAMLTIQKAAQDGTWQAAAWYLERTDREHYGRYTQVAGADGGAVKLNVTVEDMEKVLKELIDQETAYADETV